MKRKWQNTCIFAHLWLHSWGVSWKVNHWKEDNRVMEKKEENQSSGLQECHQGHRILPADWGERPMIKQVHRLWELMHCTLGLPRCHCGSESVCQCRRGGFDPWGRKIPWRRKWQPIPLSMCEIPWTEEPGGRQSMGHKEPDMTEHAHRHVLHLRIERNKQLLLD